MKTIAVILPINNPDILKQADLDSYQSKETFFKVHYVNTHLKELMTADDVAQVSALTIEKAEQVVKEGASAIVIFAFGEFGFEKELQKKLSTLVVTLGSAAINKASSFSKKKFTILPGMLSHNAFLEDMVLKMQKNNYTPATYSPESSPAQIRGDKKILEKLIAIASKEIQENNVDAFTLGCGSFIGISAPLQTALQKAFGTGIYVVDPITTTFEFVKNKIA